MNHQGGAHGIASHRNLLPDLAFPIGALIFSEVDRLVRAGRLDPIPYFRRHTRGDWATSTSSNGRPTAPRFNRARRWNRTT
jgi:hypothetical protein